MSFESHLSVKTPVLFKMFVAVPMLPFLVAYTLWGNPWWPAVLVAGVVLYYPVQQLGQAIGYHKLFAHRAFTPRPWYPYLATLVASVAFYGDPLSSAMVHRLHHRYADTDRDPHSPLHGRFHAYLGWMRSYTPDVKDARCIADLLRDYPWMVRFRRYEWIVPWGFHTTLYVWSPMMSCAVLIACWLSIQNALLLNTYSHDPHDPRIEGVDRAVDTAWLARWVNPAFMHRYHHTHASLADYTHAGVRDHWARFIDRFLTRTR
jgi:stearoyl-CoA desaturase (delta-9 desaturase)